MAFHERLGEGLAAFEDRRCCCRAEAGDTYLVEDSGNPRGQWRLGPDHDQIHGVLVGRPGKTVQVTRGDVPALGDLRDSGVARRTVDLVNAGTPVERPDESVFAATAADHKYVHTNPVCDVKELLAESEAGESGDAREAGARGDYNKAAKAV
jgi:hypothetical protein